MIIEIMLILICIAIMLMFLRAMQNIQSLEDKIQSIMRDMEMQNIEKEKKEILIERLKEIIALKSELIINLETEEGTK